jgi:hypothetical protein
MYRANSRDSTIKGYRSECVGSILGACVFFTFSMYSLLKSKCACTAESSESEAECCRFCVGAVDDDDGDEEDGTAISFIAESRKRRPSSASTRAVSTEHKNVRSFHHTQLSVQTKKSFDLLCLQQPWLCLFGP